MPMSNRRVSTWSGIRNKLENDYLCPALRGHIQYFATSYSKSADHEGRAAIRMDGVEVLRSNYYTYFENVWTKFHHLRSTTLKDCDSAKEAINQAHAFALEQGTFDQKVFYEAFGIFDNQSIEKSLVSENPPDWDLPAGTVQSGLETLLSHLGLVQGGTALLYEMT